MTREARVLRSQLAPRLLQRVANAGGRVDRLIQRYSLPDDAARLDEVAMPLERFRDFSEDCAAAAKDPNIGLHAAQALSHGNYGALEFAARSAPTVGGALDVFCQFSAATNALTRFAVEREGKWARFTVSVPGDREGLGRQGHEYTVAGVFSIGERLAGRALSVKRVFFSHRAPDDVSELSAHFRCDTLEFDAESTGFEFPSEILSIALPSSDEALRELLTRDLRQKFGELDDLELAVKKKLQHGLERGDVSLDAVAKALLLTPRTLQRRLSDRGVKFTALVDSMREARAREELHKPNVVLGQLAFQLGYSDLPAFVRAFKRWTGTTPDRFRRGEGPRKSSRAR